MDEAGPVGLALCVAAIPFMLGIAIRIETWKRCNIGIGMREAQEILIEDNWLTYKFRYVGDRYHFSGGTVMVIINLANLTRIGYEPDFRVLCFEGEIYAGYYADLLGKPAPQSLAHMEKVDSYTVPDCFEPQIVDMLWKNPC